MALCYVRLMNIDTKAKKISEAREMLWCAQRARLSQSTILKLMKALADAESA